jgi:hypothetical protein
MLFPRYLAQHFYRIESRYQCLSASFQAWVDNLDGIVDSLPVLGNREAVRSIAAGQREPALADGMAGKREQGEKVRKKAEACPDVSQAAPFRTLKRRRGGKTTKTPIEEKRVDRYGKTARYASSPSQKVQDRISRALPGMGRAASLHT